MIKLLNTNRNVELVIPLGGPSCVASKFIGLRLGLMATTVPNQFFNILTGLKKATFLVESEIEAVTSVLMGKMVKKLEKDWCRPN